MIDVWIAGDPKGQPRPRAFAFHGKARVYDPGTAEGWKGAVALALRPHVPAEPMSGPVSLSLLFVFRRPHSHLRKDGTPKPTAPIMHCGKPDVDNCAKAILDCCTTIGLWRDDTQVVDLRATKHYGATAGCRLIVSTL